MSDSRMLAQLLTVSFLILVETSADVLVQPGYYQPGLNQGHQRRQDSSQHFPQQQYFQQQQQQQQQQQWQRRDSSNPYQSPYTGGTNPAVQRVSTSLVSPFLLPPHVSPFGGVGPAGRLFSLGPLGLQTLRIGGLGGYGLPPLLGSPYSQNHLAAHSQFPRSTDRQLEGGIFGHEKRNDTIWKNDDVASKSSMKPLSESERRPAFPGSQVNNINERVASWKGNGKSDHQIVGGSLLDPLGFIEKTENAIENFGEHLPAALNPFGPIGGMNSHSGLPAALEPHLWRESDNSKVQQTQNASQDVVPLGSPGNPKTQTNQSPLLGSRVNSTDSQASTQHRESYRPTSYQSVLRESSPSNPSNPVGSPARLHGNLGAENQRYRVDSSALPYRQRTLENPITYQDGSSWKNAHVAQGQDSVGDRANGYRGSPVNGQSFPNYPSNPIGRTQKTAMPSYPYASAASPSYGNPSYGYNNNNNNNANAKAAVGPSRTGQNREFGGSQQRTTGLNNYPVESSYGPNNAQLAASRRQNIPAAQYRSASQGRTTPLFQDYEYSRPFYGYGNNFLPGGFDRFGSSLSPPLSPQAWLPRPYTFYNDHVFDDIGDFSYRSYRPTF